MPFVISVSRRVKLITGEWVATMTNKQLVSSLQKTVGLYRKGGFRVVIALMDGQFESLIGSLAEMGVEANICTANEHIP